MDDLKNLTVRYLRELARKHLGKGYSKLKTKEELVSALKKAVPGALKPAKAKAAAVSKTAAKPASVPAKIVRFAKQAIDRSFGGTVPGKRPQPPAGPPSAGSPPQLVPAPPARQPEAKAERPIHTPKVPAASPTAAKAPAKGAPVAPTAAKAPPTLVSAASPSQARPPAQAPAAASRVFTPEQPSSPEAPASEVSTPDLPAFEEAPVAEVASPPLVEGFFVARVAGEGEVRRHRLTEEQSPPVREYVGSGYDEQLGELPDSYEDDSAVLLPRDPNTLFFFWDFQSATRAAAKSGLVKPRAVIRVFEGAALVREVEFAIESRAFYIHGLPAGRAYRVEAFFVGRDGQARRVGAPTNVVALPTSGPSSLTTVRFLRIPWTMPLRLLRQYLRDGRAQIEQLLGEQEYVPVVGFAPPGSQPWALGAPKSGPADEQPSSWFPPPSGRPY